MPAYGPKTAAEPWVIFLKFHPYLIIVMPNLLLLSFCSFWYVIVTLFFRFCQLFVVLDNCKCYNLYETSL